MNAKRIWAEGLISHRVAVSAISVLFGASLAGWIASELVPVDLLEREGLYGSSWGSRTTWLVASLQLYDPFHSVWYRAILALFALILLLCVATRWRRLALRSWGVTLPADADEVSKRKVSFEFSWRPLAGGGDAARDPRAHRGGVRQRGERVEPAELQRLFGRIAALLKARGYRVISQPRGEAISFAAFTGRWRSPGTMLFHLGLIVITIGGVIGSFAGWRELIFVREGEAAPLPPDSALAIRVEDFEIALTGRGELRDFISSVAIVDDGGEAIKSGVIEVNRPMRVAGRNIYQSQYSVDENTFAQARIEYARRDGAGSGSIEVAPGKGTAVGDSSVMLMATRYLPDFRMSPQGPFSASTFPANPALELEIVSAAGAERGWLFLLHPDFSKRFAAPVDLALTRCDPVYYTGLEVSANPGAPVLLAGIALATAGLVLMYFCNPRVLKGIAASERISVGGFEYRWKASFEKEFDEIREAMRSEMHRWG